MKITDINFIEEDKTDKHLRKDITYLCKLFGQDSLPEWLVNKILKIRRNDRNFALLSSKGSIYAIKQKGEG